MNCIEATVQPLFSKDLAADPGRELSMIAVEYPPGSVDPVQTRHAQALVTYSKARSSCRSEVGRLCRPGFWCSW